MSEPKRIPVCEPFLAGNELAYVSEAVSGGWISSAGKYVDQFEREFAKFSENNFAVSTSNGTTALHLAVVALNITRGDEVIIPTFTMAASAFAVCYAGATPVFVDARRDTWNIDEKLIEAKISPRTKAIMTVSILGNPGNMPVIESIAKKYNLAIIEDAAEGHGARISNKSVSNYSVITAYSFYANKHLTTGEGGMVTTNDRNLYDRCRYFRNMCFSLDGNRNYVHADIGFNYRMSNVIAAIGLAQVEKLPEYVEMRIQNGSRYRKNLSSIEGIILQQSANDAKPVYWMNGIVVDPQKYGRTRDELRVFLGSQGIETRLFFAGMHLQPALKKYGADFSGAYPVSDWLTENGFYLPSGTGLIAEDIDFICEKIRGFRGR